MKKIKLPTNLDLQKIKSYGAVSAKSDLKPLIISRREPLANDVVIEISHCGICHSDIHTARSEWGPAHYPCVPGHEIVGKVVVVGKKVTRFKVGDFAGVGCFVDSCGQCKNCKSDQQQFCEEKTTYTYNSLVKDEVNPTYGGYSTHIVVKEKYVLKIKKNLPLAQVAPLLCAGITTYSPLKRYKVKKGTKVGVIGLGGLGHMAVKIASAMGAQVTVFSTSLTKQKDSKKFGAKYFVLTRDTQNSKPQVSDFDLIIDTVSAKHDLNNYLNLLKIDGTLVLLGVPPEPSLVHAFSLIGGRKKLTGSLIGGLKETQEMLDFCAKKKVFSEIELISAQQINKAYERTIKGDVKYRFVIDAKTF